MGSLSEAGGLNYSNGDVFGQEVVSSHRKLDALPDDTRGLLFGDSAEIESTYAEQYYTVQVVGGTTYCIASAQGGSPDNPRAVAWLPPGFVVVGGGARADWQSTGSMLTASFPVGVPGHFGWEARCLGDDESGGSLSVYAIGVKAS